MTPPPAPCVGWEHCELGIIVSNLEEFDIFSKNIVSNEFFDEINLIWTMVKTGKFAQHLCRLGALSRRDNYVKSWSSPFWNLGSLWIFFQKIDFLMSVFKPFWAAFLDDIGTVVSMLNPALHVPKFPNWNLGNLCILRTFSTLIWISPLTKCGQQVFYAIFAPCFMNLKKYFFTVINFV